MPVAEAFRALTDPELFDAWLGVPVTVDGGVFAATMEWGTAVRGRYVVLVEPCFIHFTWDLADDGTPAPGGELPAYVHIEELPRGRARVEVRQVVNDRQQASYMRRSSERRAPAGRVVATTGVARGGRTRCLRGLA